MGNYRARTEVQGTEEKYREVEKYRARWGSSGHGGEVQGAVGKYRMRWEITGHGGKYKAR